MTTAHPGSGAIATSATDPFSTNTSSSSAAFGDDDDEFGAFAAAAPTSSPSSDPAGAAAAAGAPFATSSGNFLATGSFAAPYPSVPSAVAAAVLPERAFLDDEYDNPFADIVHEAPKSAGASRTNSFDTMTAVATSTPSSINVLGGGDFTAAQTTTLLQSQAQTSAVSLAFGSPLLSFSPIGTPPAASAPLDIFAAADAADGTATTAEAELLSFSPLLLSASAPPRTSSMATSSFLLDSPDALSKSSSAVTTSANTASPPRFALPPPRTASSPALRAAATNAPSNTGNDRAATFTTTHVSIGELLSFSPVASPKSFGGSFASSNSSNVVAAAAASSTMLFGDDELFSLSMPLPTALSAADEPSTLVPTTPVDVFAGHTFETASPVPLDNVSNSSDALAFESPVAAVPQTSPAAEQFEAWRDPVDPVDNTITRSTADDKPVEHPVATTVDTENDMPVTIERDPDALDAVDARTSASTPFEEPMTIAELVMDPADESLADDATRLSIPSPPAGYSQFAFITHQLSPAAASGSGPFDASSSSLARSATSTQSHSSAGPRDVLSASGSSDAGTPTLTPTHEPARSVDYASFSSVGGSSQSDSEGSSRSPHKNGDSVDSEAPADVFEDSPAAIDVTENVESEQSASAVSDDTIAHDHANAAATTHPEAFSGFDTDAQHDAFGEFDAAPSLEETITSFTATIADDNDDDDDFSDFARPSTIASDVTGDDNDDFGDFGQSVAAPTTGADATIADRGDDDDSDDDGFGDFGQSFPASASSAAAAANDDDDFGDFGQGTTGFAADGDDDDAFGDFAQSSSAAAATTASTTATSSFAAVPVVSNHATSPPATSKADLERFFTQAFASPASSSIAPLEPAAVTAALTSTSSLTNELFHDNKLDRPDALLSTIYCSAIERYCQAAPASSVSQSSSTQAITASTGAAAQGPAERRALRLKHLKYVLSEKIQDAARHDGLFPHGSQQHHALLALVDSDNEQQMRDALTSVQDALFTSSVNAAMMRMARQAALSAKAKIAEQAAHQQAASRGSLLATTRHLLSRSGHGSSGGSSGQAMTMAGGSGGSTSSSGSQDTSDAATAAAATAAANASHSASGSGSGGDDSGGENSGGEGSGASHSGGGRSRRSGSSESDFVGAASHGKQTGSGGLMKKFQDRFSPFSSSRGRTRLVSLRRTGDSGEDVRQMELNMDSISGGLDQVKWKCAVFLYDVDEVAQVAPSQIRIVAYPSKEALAAKSDRAALLKLLKPGTVWTVDIGASNNDVLNAW